MLVVAVAEVAVVAAAVAEVTKRLIEDKRRLPARSGNSSVTDATPTASRVQGLALKFKKASAAS